MKRPGIVVAVALAVVLAGGAGGWAVLRLRAGPKPGPVAAAYVDAWRRSDYAAMQRLLLATPTDFAGQHQRMLADLTAERVTLDLGPVTTARHAKGRAQAQVGVTVRSRLLPAWSYRTTLRLVQRQRRWLVDWSPATLHPDLRAGQRFSLQLTWPARAPILARDGSSLAGSGDVVRIGLFGQAIKDRGQVVAALTGLLGLSPGRAAALVATAQARPTQLVVAAAIPNDRYLGIRGRIHDIPGIRFRQQQGRVTAGAASFRAAVGTVAPATADDLRRLGPPYRDGDLVGHGGLEQAFERQLAGTPTAEIDLVNPDRSVAKVLRRVDGQPGRPLASTLDPKVQAAAERAFTGVTRNAALVALQASSGEVRAVVNWPTSGSFDRALLGRYPAGSTFKVITATALLDAGVKPDDPVACPPSITVEGLTFGNFEGESAAGGIPFHTAFAISCNTAFIGLATRRLSGRQLTAAAARYGFGADLPAGLPGATSRVPTPRGKAELANEAIGQGRVAVTPLQMASVAAAVDAGAWRPPRLLAGQQGDQPRPLEPSVDAALQRFMAEVVNHGTGVRARLPGAQVYGKTGTAEFGAVKPLRTHAWFIGFRGDLAFAVVVENGGVGGEVAAPIAASFLRGLG